MSEIFKKLGEKFPFLSLIRKGDLEFVGIVQNQDQNVISFYDYGKITEKKDKDRFLGLGEQWWWESNRKLPINIFIKNFIDNIDKVPITNLLPSPNNVSNILSIMTRYLAYYIYLSIAYNYNDSRDLYITNM